jgi:hypothetical protein
VRLAAATAAVLAVAACGGGGDDDDDDSAADAATIDVSDLVYAACADDARVGGFAVELTDEYTGVQGKVADGVVPSTIFEPVAFDDACMMLTAPQLACDPACTSDETCSADGCIPYPRAISVGTVTVAGLAAPVEMEPLPPTMYYTNPGTLPHPGYAPGDGIALTATGGDVDPFTLRGWGVSALEIADAAVVVEAGAALELAWTAPPADGPTQVLLSLNVNGHGLVGSRVQCVVDDTGAYTIPEPLITALVDDGLSGFPTLEVTRSSADRVVLDIGCVDLRVQTTRVLDVTVPGLTSCNEDEDCPDGQTCRGDLTCE